MRWSVLLLTSCISCQCVLACDRSDDCTGFGSRSGKRVRSISVECFDSPRGFAVLLLLQRISADCSTFHPVNIATYRFARAET